VLVMVRVTLVSSAGPSAVRRHSISSHVNCEQLQQLGERLFTGFQKGAHACDYYAHTPCMLRQRMHMSGTLK
jgi:hypothetical protein